ncbi:MAG: hypothetical protein HYT49_02805 [Candidatus Wildermuthbacteria bacterium]|nr:hypothetical protein [Candidatus Wildermuthbacteria bacterium]
MKHIILLAGIILFSSPVFAQGTEYIYVSPILPEYQIGKEMPLEVRLSAPESITSFRIHLRYDTALLEVQEVRPNKEVFPFWWSQGVEDGFIELEASAPSPGFSGEDLIATVVVTAKQPGNKMLEVDEDSSLLLNAQDENILEQEGIFAGDLLPGMGLAILLGILVLGGLVAGVVVFWRARRK